MGGTEFGSSSTATGELERELVELTRRLIRNRCVNDGSPGSGQEARNAEALAEVLDHPGIEVETFEAAPGRVNLVARLPGRAPGAPGLGYVAHTDVYPAPDADRWAHDPFAADLDDDGILWGRGAVSLLGHAATMAVALRRLADDGFTPDGDLVFAAMADEESGGRLGTAWMLEHHPERLAFDQVITATGGAPIPSPSGPLLPVVCAGRGSSTYRLHVGGDSPLEALPHGERSALSAAAEVVRRVEETPEPTAPNPLFDALIEQLDLFTGETGLDSRAAVRKALPYLPARLAAILFASCHTERRAVSLHSSGVLERLPGEAVVEVNVRSLPGESSAEIEAALVDALGDLAGQVDIEAVRVQPGPPPSPAGTPLWEVLDAAVRPWYPTATLVPAMTPTTSDSHHFRARGVVTYGFGLYSTRILGHELAEMIQGRDERVDVTSLVMMAGLWEAVARQFLGPAPTAGG